MTGEEMAVVIAATAGLVTAVGSTVTTLIVTLRAGRKIEEIHVATNGMKDALVKVTAESEFAKGLKQGEDNPLPKNGR